MDNFKERLEKISLRNAKVKHKKNHTWPIEKRIEVVSQYLVLGNMKMVSAVTGVNHDLIRQWKAQPWWPELEKEIRATQNIEMDTKLSKIVDRSLDQVMDRLENGDFIYDQKTGQIKRKPVALRDVHRVSVDMIDKRELLRGNTSQRQENAQVSVQEQLKLLAQEFAKWVDKDKPKPIELVEIEDAVYVDQNHEDNSEGISAGIEDSGDDD